MCDRQLNDLRLFTVNRGTRSQFFSLVSWAFVERSHYWLLEASELDVIIAHGYQNEPSTSAKVMRNE